MQGVQPIAKMMPSSGAPTRPVRGCQLGLIVRCRKVTCPMKTRPTRMMIDPADADQQVLVLDEEAPDGAGEQEHGEEDQAEAGDEQRGAGDHPSAGALGSARRAAHVAEVAGHERQHARRDEREQAGGERDRQREPESAADDDVARAH